MSNWQAGASVSMLKARARLLQQLRDFFSTLNVLEVETPLLANATVSDLHIQSWNTEQHWGKAKRPLYLQSSPEYSMKRLLASGSGAIYQICKAFRNEERSQRHNPEFTMLEWYQPGYSLDDLMDEVEALIRLVTGCDSIRRTSYHQLFDEFLSIDPHTIFTTDLEQLVKSKINIDTDSLSRTDYLQLLLSHVIEPEVKGNWFLFDYPEDQAALARVVADENGVLVAKRFELFCGGMEIANGYFELADPIEQRRRFESDLKKRAASELKPVPLDENLIAALESGIPDCAGVALGVDRLLMLVTGADSINEVIAFNTDRA